MSGGCRKDRMKGEQSGWAISQRISVSNEEKRRSVGCGGNFIFLQHNVCWRNRSVRVASKKSRDDARFDRKNNKETTSWFSPWAIRSSIHCEPPTSERRREWCENCFYEASNLSRCENSFYMKVSNGARAGFKSDLKITKITFEMFLNPSPSSPSRGSLSFYQNFSLSFPFSIHLNRHSRSEARLASISKPYTSS